MNAQDQAQSLQNAADKIGLFIHIKHNTDKRKKKPLFFLSKNGVSISPVLDYLNMNHFILGYSKHYDLLSFEPLFFVEFSAQRRELRKMWNGTGKDWAVFLIESEKKAVKVLDALKISPLQLSQKYDINEIFKLYSDLYKPATT